MKKHLIFVILLLISLLSFGQTDQLKNLFQKALIHRANPDSGLYYSNEALILSNELRFETSEQLSKMYAGLVHFNMEKIDTASTLLYNALPYLDGLDFEQGMAHWYIGKIHLRTRTFGNAEDHFQSAKNAFQKSDSLTYLGDVYNSLGVLNGMQTNYSQALTWFIKAYELKIEIGAELEVASELSNISMVYTRMGSFNKAIDFVWQSINLLDDDDDYSAYSALGGTYNLMGKRDSAEIYYQICLEIAKKNGHQRRYRHAISNLGNIYYQKEAYEKVISIQKTALHLAKEDPKNLFGIYTELGKAYRKLKQFDSASYYLKLGFKLSQQSKDKNWAKQAATFIAYTYSDQKIYDSAFYYLTQNLAYIDSLNGERVQEIFADQRVSFETLKKQNEIEVLQKQNKINQYKQRAFLIGGIFILAILILIFLNYRTRQLLKQKSLLKEKLVVEKELDKKRAELSAHTLNMIHRKNSLDEIEERIEQLEDKDKQKIGGIININKALEKDWDNFNKYFGQVHARFFEMLRQDFSALSQSEIRLSALIKMNLANHEIATLLNIEPKSVRMARYRLRKKLNLDEETDLNFFIQNI